MATLKEIAEITKVSITTVSRILNNDTTLNVSTKTREEVLEVTKKLGYKTIGQRYKDRKTKKYKVGIAQMFELDEQKKDIYYIMMKNVLEEVCLEKNIEVISLFRNQDKNFIKITKKKIDGIFPIGRFTLEEISNFENYTKNIVFIDSSPDELTYHSIIPNYQLGVKIALKHFLDKGHKDIGFVGSKYTFGNTKDWEIDSRYVYFKSFLEGNNLFNEKYIVECEMNSKSGYNNIIKFLKNSKLPSAFFISSDAIASGILKAFSEKNIKIPEDVSIITFNDTPLSEFATPALSSIRIFMREYADAAIRRMEELWEGEHVVKKVIMTCNLIERDSVKDKGDDKRKVGNKI